MTTLEKAIKRLRQFTVGTSAGDFAFAKKGETFYMVSDSDLKLLQGLSGQRTDPHLQSVLKEVEAKVGTLSSLRAAYCHDCAVWIIPIWSHNLDHTMDEQVKFVRSEEVLSIIRAKSKEQTPRTGHEAEEEGK